MFIIFTGDGKGKTTAALGQAMRTVGDGKNVLMVQFIKGPWISGEDRSHKKLSPRMRIVKKGLGFVGIGGDTFPREAHMKAAREALDFAMQEVANGGVDMIILDEITNAIDLGLIKEGDAMNFLEYALPRAEHVIFTGRNCPPALINAADLVTEMRAVKHPFESGVKGKKGLEY